MVSYFDPISTREPVYIFDSCKTLRSMDKKTFSQIQRMYYFYKVKKKYKIDIQQHITSAHILCLAPDNFARKKILFRKQTQKILFR